MKRKYESLIVFDPVVGEAQVKEEIKKVQKLLETNGCENLSVDNWGRREIAYRVKKNKFGVYVKILFESGRSEAVETLTNTLRITDSVLMHQVNRMPEKIRKFKGNPRRIGKYDASDFDFGDSSDLEY